MITSLISQQALADNQQNNIYQIMLYNVILLFLFGGLLQTATQTEHINTTNKH